MRMSPPPNTIYFWIPRSNSCWLLLSTFLDWINERYCTCQAEWGDKYGGVLASECWLVSRARGLRDVFIKLMTYWGCRCRPLQTPSVCVLERTVSLSCDMLITSCRHNSAPVGVRGVELFPPAKQQFTPPSLYLSSPFCHPIYFYPLLSISRSK